MMQEHTEYQRSIEIIRNAIPRMSELKIPITPNNYAVWYEYLNDSNQELRDEMDALLSRGQPITNNEMRALYERYLEKNDEKLQVAKQALGQVVNALMQHIDQAGGHYSRFSSELNSIASSLEEDTSGEDLNALMDRAMRATRAALKHGEELKQQISSLASEMEEVRSRLAHSQEQARRDALTGLLNRLAFQEILEQLPAMAETDGHLPCLLILDIDHFKRVNDTHGHLVGDHTLRQVAQEIEASIRGRDQVARFGGEEFAVLLRDTPRSGCVAVAENIRSNVEKTLVELPADLAQDLVLSVTISIGGAHYRIGEPAEALVERADRNLYRSKQEGRNRVTWEESVPVS